MRITIETDGSDVTSIQQDGYRAQAPTSTEASDGGGAPQELVALLSGEQTVEEAGMEAEGGTVQASYSEDAGGAPAWLVDVIEGSAPMGQGRFTDE